MLYILHIHVDAFLVKKKVYYGHEINENKHYLQWSKINTRDALIQQRLIA